MKKIGIIDVGSNSHRLLAVAVEGETITELARGKITTRMLSGLKDGAFTREAIDKNIEAIAQLKAQAEDAGCTRFIAFATSAMRDASNRQQVIDEVHARYGARSGRNIRMLTMDEADMVAAAGAPGQESKNDEHRHGTGLLRVPGEGHGVPSGQDQ